MKYPKLFRASDLCTEKDWRWHLEDSGHIWFWLDGRYYFVFPEGEHKFGLCYYEDSETGNFPRWTFDSESALLNEKIFNGKSILERLDDVMSYEPEVDYDMSC